MAADQNTQFAVITGASSGIGFELAKVFAAEGFPDSKKAEMHRQIAEPGSAREN